MNTLEMVKEFHEKFGHPVSDEINVRDPFLNRLRAELISEELSELADGLRKNDKFEVFDALLDLQYVLDGAFLAFGLHQFKEAGFKEVHASNMSKLGEDGRPIYRDDGKILKGPNYFTPDLEKILKG